MVSVAFGPVAATLEERRELLRAEGPLIDVIVHREPGAEPHEGIPPSYETRALIDTGASDSCVDYRIVHALRLRQTNQTRMRVVGTSVLVTVHLGVLEIPALSFKGIVELYSSSVTRPKYNALIGRPFLANYGFHLDGPSGMFHIDIPPLDPIRSHDHDGDIG